MSFAADAASKDRAGSVETISGQSLGRSLCRHAAGCVAILALLLVVGCAGRQGDRVDDDAPRVRSGTAVPYDVVVSGADPELTAFLTEVSESVAQAATPPPSLLALRRRAASDETRLTSALASEGYFDGAIVADVAVPEEEGRATLTLAVASGVRYSLAEVIIEVAEPSLGYAAPKPDTLGLTAGMPARAAAVVDAEARLLADARARGRAYAALGERQAIIDRDAKTLDVTLRLAPGPEVTLGPATFEGTEGIDADFVGELVAWRPGDRYQSDLVAETRRALVETGLFQRVDVVLPVEPPPEGDAPITIRTTQRLHRTISGGVRLESDAGPGGDVSWENRNFLGSGDTARLRLDADRLLQSVEASLRRPALLGPDRSLLAQASAVREDNDAFESVSVDASIGVEEEFSDELTGSIGVGYEFSEVTDANGTTNFGLFFVPALLRYDGTDETLDATRGVAARFEATPFWNTFDPELGFNQFRLDASTYFRLNESPRLVLAVRSALGSIVGAARDDIPANRRFYAGGGGSVRGVPFQTASPLDDDGTPLGGRSLFEAAGELRYRVVDSVDIVGFVDAGRAFEASFPDFVDPLVFGAGLGARYVTPIGPIRFDVAIPVDRRDVDDAFQVYVGLGQAF